MTEQSYEPYRPAADPEPEPPVRRTSAGGCCGGSGAVQRWAMIVAVCIGIWALTGAGHFWPMWVVFGLGFALLHGRR